jgi:penicillin V acylase-like amidase (Ntn superfamily)
MCTRIFWSDNDVAKVVSRTMDWQVSDEPRLWTLPAGMHRSGGVPDGLSWQSQYGSVGLSMWDAGTSDGVNDQGLGAHLLYLEAADFGAPDARPAIANTHWAQWVLDNFATVADAVDAMSSVRITSNPLRGQRLNCHLAIDDVTGDSAIIEAIDGKLVVHHGQEFGVMANDPLFDDQLANLHRYRPFGGDLPLPGDILSTDRFVRATYFLAHLPPPRNVDEAVAGVIHIGSNVAVPPGAPYDDFSVYPTWWMSAIDLTNRTYYFWSRLSPALTWLSLDVIDLSAGAPIRALQMEKSDLAGDIAPDLTTWNQPLPY